MASEVASSYPEFYYLFTLKWEGKIAKSDEARKYDLGGVWQYGEKIREAKFRYFCGMPSFQVNTLLKDTTLRQMRKDDPCSTSVLYLIFLEDGHLSKMESVSVFEVDRCQRHAKDACLSSNLLVLFMQERSFCCMC